MTFVASFRVRVVLVLTVALILGCGQVVAASAGDSSRPGVEAGTSSDGTTRQNDAGVRPDSDAGIGQKLDASRRRDATSLDSAQSSDVGAQDSAQTHDGGAQSDAPYQGYVSFLDELGDAGAYSIELGFTVTLPEDDTFDCPGLGVQQGPCCVVGPFVLGSPPYDYDVSAGTAGFSVVGGAMLGSAAYQFDLQGYAGITGVSWATGDMLSVSLAGDPSGVGAFVGTVQAPPVITGIVPTIEGVRTVPRDADFILKWQPSGSGVVTLTFNDLSIGGGIGLITCTADNATGMLDVPSAAFSGFMPGDMVALDVSVVSTTVALAANASVTVTATIDVAEGDHATFK